MTIGLRTATDNDAIIPSSLEPTSRRRFTQTLEVAIRRLWSRAEREILSVFAHARLESDFARPVIEGSPDPRESEPVDFILQRAHVDFRPVDWVLARGGRQFLYGPLPPVDVDGLVVDLMGPLGLSGRVGGGREVRLWVPGVDGEVFDRPGGRWDTFGDPKPETSWLVQGEFGWRWGEARVRAGHRTSLRHGDRVGQHTGVAGSMRWDWFGAHLGALFNHLLASFDRLDVRVEVPVDAVHLRSWLGWRYLRPSFDGDSIFNVFAVTPWVEWRVGAEVDLSERLGLSLEGNQRAFEEAEEVPWSGGFGEAEAVSRGLVLRGHFAVLPVLRLRATLSGDGGYGGTLLSGDAAALWEVVPARVDLGLRLRYAYRESDRRENEMGHMLAARLQGGYNLSSFGRVQAWIDYVADDYQNGQALRVMALVDFELGPI